MPGKAQSRRLAFAAAAVALFSGCSQMASQALTLFRLLVASGKSELDGSSVVTLLPEPEPVSEAPAGSRSAT